MHVDIVVAGVWGCNGSSSSQYFLLRIGWNIATAEHTTTSSGLSLCLAVSRDDLRWLRVSDGRSGSRPMERNMNRGLSSCSTRLVCVPLEIVSDSRIPRTKLSFFSIKQHHPAYWSRMFALPTCHHLARSGGGRAVWHLSLPIPQRCDISKSLAIDC